MDGKQITLPQVRSRAREKTPDGYGTLGSVAQSASLHPSPKKRKNDPFELVLIIYLPR